MSKDQTSGPAPAKIWYLAPGAIPVEESDKRARDATHFAFDGDYTLGLPWRPIAELAGYRKQQATAPLPRSRKESRGQGKFPSRKP